MLIVTAVHYIITFLNDSATKPRKYLQLPPQSPLNASLDYLL
jgi:hypothetical protein